MSTVKKTKVFPGWPTLLLLFAALLATIPTAPSKLTAQQSSRWDLAFSFGTFGGQFEFADSTYLPRQDMLAGKLGIDFGRGVLLRGYYWQGINGDWEDTDPIFGYGSEIQFDLNLFSAVKPFFLAGIGKMDFEDDFEDKLGNTPEELTTYTLGAGIAVDLTRWLRLDVTARDYLIRRPDVRITPYEDPLPELPEIEETLHSNFLLTGGLTITLGRRKTAAAAGSIVSGEAYPLSGEYPAPGPQVAGAPGGVILVPSGIGAEPAAEAAALVDSLERETGFLLADETVRTILAVEMGYVDALFPEEAKLGEERTPLSGARADTLRIRLTRRMHEAFEHLARVESASVMVALGNQLDEFNVTLDAKDEILSAAQETLDERIRQMEAEGIERIAQLDSMITWKSAEATRRRRLSGSLGGTFGNGTQLLMGGQLGLASPWSPSFSFVSEVTLGFFSGGVSTLAQESLRYHYPKSGVQPYGGLGLGVLVLSDKIGDLSGANFVVTPIMGVEIPATDMKDVFGERLMGYFVEYQGVKFFDLHRVVFGINWRL